MLLFTLFATVLLAGQSTLVFAKTYDFCPGYSDNTSGNIGGRSVQDCLKSCDETFGCKTFYSFAFQGRLNCYRGPYDDNPTYVPSVKPLDTSYGLSAGFLGVARDDPLLPAVRNLPQACVVCTTDTCFNCSAFYSTTGECIQSCPAGQTANSARGCVCDVPGCDCVAPRYYSSESGGCVLPSILTETAVETSTPVETSTIITGTPPTATITITEQSTTTPATSTITALTTSFTGKTKCVSFKATFPAACCPNKFVAGLRPIANSNLVRREIRFSATTTTSTTTTLASTSTVLEEIAGPTPTSRVTEISFAQAPTPISTTSSTAFALSTACAVDVQVGLSRCLGAAITKTYIEALMRSYQRLGKRVAIDCGSGGMFDLP